MISLEDIRPLSVFQADKKKMTHLQPTLLSGEQEAGRSGQTAITHTSFLMASCDTAFTSEVHQKLAHMNSFG